MRRFNIFHVNDNNNSCKPEIIFFVMSCMLVKTFIGEMRIISEKAGYCSASHSPLEVKNNN